MALETSTYINGLIATNPTSTDNVGDGDNHIRLLKSTIKATFPNITGALTATHTAIDLAIPTVNAATDANTASTIVKRDASGNFTAGTVTAALTGNVTGNVTGDVTGNIGGTTGTFTGAVSFGSLTDSGESITITKFVDEADGISSNDNDTTIPTSAAIKNYVDGATVAPVLAVAATTGDWPLPIALNLSNR